ncbi:hypothetical protein LA080_011295 [Diaporthe eres]|nr:hypothetical protein LA080_011295 [Diaporthe eres]
MWCKCERKRDGLISRNAISGLSAITGELASLAGILQIDPSSPADDSDLYHLATQWLLFSSERQYNSGSYICTHLPH